MTKDPRFPNRPEHPDFWIISEAVIDLDASSDRGTKYKDISGPIVDPDSALYVAKQRIGRMLQVATERGITPEDVASLPLAGWMDGFFAGAEYHRIKSTKTTPDFPPGKGKHHHG